MASPQRGSAASKRARFLRRCTSSPLAVGLPVLSAGYLPATCRPQTSAWESLPSAVFDFPAEMVLPPAQGAATTVNAQAPVASPRDSFRPEFLAKSGRP